MCIHRKENNHVFTDFLFRFSNVLGFLQPTHPNVQIYDYTKCSSSGLPPISTFWRSVQDLLLLRFLEWISSIVLLSLSWWILCESHIMIIIHIYTICIFPALFRCSSVRPSRRYTSWSFPKPTPVLTSCDHATLITYFIRREIFPNGGPLYSYISNEPKCRSFTCAAVY